MILALAVIASSVRGRDLDRFADGHLRGVAAMLFVVDPTAGSDVAGGLLRDAYGMTQAEVRVAISVASGLSIPETAGQLGLSRNTVKTHLAKVFALSGTNWQVDLARLIASIGMLKWNGEQAISLPAAPRRR